jgi:hypothetical protein
MRMKIVYCSNCGMRLQIYRKALPKYATIIDLVEHHTCPDEPVEFDLSPAEVPTFVQMDGKFVQKLNNLNPLQKVRSIVGEIDSNDLRDRRFEVDEKVKSSAPSILQTMLKDIGPSTPSHELNKDPEEE